MSRKTGNLREKLNILQLCRTFLKKIIEKFIGKQKNLALRRR